MKVEYSNCSGRRKGTVIGNFRVVSGRVVVSDPCYEIGTWCQGILEKVRKGEWVCQVSVSREDACDRCVTELTALRNPALDLGNPKWTEETSFEVGVDSGQAGIFDMAHYRDDRVAQAVERLSRETICPDEPWYSLCCDRTSGSEMGAGVIPYGVVSSSGFGDGSYRCFTQRDREGYIIGIKIVFITQVDEEAGG